MKVTCYALVSEKLRQSAALPCAAAAPQPMGEIWLDVAQAQPDELRAFLAPLNLHPLQVERCLDEDINPGVLAYPHAVMMEYPAALESASASRAYLTILLADTVLVTVRHGEITALDNLIRDLCAESAPAVRHLPQLIFQILDEFSDLNVDVQIKIRDQIQNTAKLLAERPEAVDANDLTQLRWQIGSLIGLLEDQLYCISGLAASDIEALREPHRKAYIQDLVSESEIAQRAAYRLETRVNDLYHDYQMLGSDRVERRLRLLTIVSAITLPLGLVAGLLGMNVGGVPGIENPIGFWIVVALMAVIGLAQYLFFKARGWFD